MAPSLASGEVDFGASFPVALALLDLEGRFVAVNEALVGLFGRPRRSDLVGRSFSDFLVGGQRPFELWRSQLTVRGQHSSISATILDALQNPQRVRLDSTVVAANAGAAPQIAVAFHAQAAAPPNEIQWPPPAGPPPSNAEGDEWRRAVTEAANKAGLGLAISVLEGDGEPRLRFINAMGATILGRGTHELIGGPGFPVVTDSQDAEARRRFHDETSKPHSLRTVMVQIGGTEAPPKLVEVGLAAGDFDGKSAIFAFFHDVTDRAKVESLRLTAVALEKEAEILRATADFKTRFINTACHELRTPLTPLLIQVQVMLNNKASPPSASQAKALHIMKRNLDRLKVLFEDFLTVANTQAGRLRVDPKPVDLGALLGQAADTVRTTASHRGVELSVTHPASAPIVADQDRLLQVLVNLLDNALKFTAKGGHVLLTCDDEGTNVRVRVTDTGIGIAEADQRRLFNPFVQVHDTTQVTEPGSGLGLYICKELVLMHGGAIGVQSPGQGQGSTFWFTLPKAAGP